MHRSSETCPKLRSPASALVLATLALCGPVLAGQQGSVTTTVYVGRHFEIRDHDQPTKYIFNGATRVAAVTGSLSSNARVQRMRLWHGWNLVSLAVSASDLADQLQQAQPGLVQGLYQWDQATGGYLAVASGQAVAAGAVLWVEAATNGDAAILGAYSDPSNPQVPAGGAYLAGTGLEAWTPALPADCSGWTFDSQSDRWHGELAGSLASISEPPCAVAPGEAIYLRADEAIELEIPDPTLRVRYYHQDHLGSSSVISDADGQVVEETAFYPYGVPRNQSAPRQVRDPYQFTGKEQDRESGLDYFEARYLANWLGRFGSADPKYANAESLSMGGLSPQELNLYAYVGNNPIKLVDPTGLDGDVTMAAAEKSRAGGGVTREDLATANDTAATTVSVLDAAQSAANGEYVAKAGAGVSKLGGTGAVLGGVGVGIAAVQFAKDPTERNGANVGVALATVGIGGLCPIAGAAIAIGQLAGIDVAGGFAAVGRGVADIASQPSTHELLSNYLEQKQFEADMATTRALRADIAATQKSVQEAPLFCAGVESMGKRDQSGFAVLESPEEHQARLNSCYQETLRLQEHIMSDERQIHAIWTH